MSRMLPAAEYYRPNSGEGFEPARLTPEPMTYQRPETEATDTVIRLRRCPKPLPNTGTYWMKNKARPLRVEPLELEIAQALPGICPAHGRPATTTRPVRTHFYDTDVHPRHPNMAIARELAGRREIPSVHVMAPVSTIVDADWPTCERCDGVSLWRRVLARGVLAMLALNVLAVIVIAVTDICPPQLVLIYNLFPGSALWLVIVVKLYTGAEQAVPFRPIYDERFAFVGAHRRFRQALAEMPAPPADNG